MMNDIKKPLERGDDKVLVGFAMTRSDLAKVDDAAKELRVSRAAFIRMALFSSECVVDVQTNKTTNSINAFIGLLAGKSKKIATLEELGRGS